MKQLLVPVLLSVITPAWAAFTLEDPLNTWQYHSETFGPLLPGEYQNRHTISYHPEHRSGWVWQLIQDRAELPLGSNGSPGFRYAASGEVIDNREDFISRGGGVLEFSARPLDWLIFHEQTSIWTGSDENPPSGFSPFHYGLEHGRHLYVDWGYARGVTGILEVSLGRIPLRWGPGRFSQLLISGKAPPMDMLKVDLKISEHVDFTGFTATISSDSSTWLSAHRLDIKPLENLRIGLSESILYSAGNIDLAYANLIIPWYPVQWNEREDDNAFLCFDASWRPVRGMVLYSEFLIDDIQYENIQNVPNKLGYTFGVDAFHPESGIGAAAEYTAVQRYVYSQRKLVNYYLHDDRIIGCQLGPDADMITGAVSWCGAEGFGAVIKGSYTRQGAADVYEGWPDSVQAGGPFPSGVVESTSRLDLDLGWYPLDWMELHLRGYVSSTENSGNIQDAESSDRGVSFQANLGQL